MGTSVMLMGINVILTLRASSSMMPVTDPHFRPCAGNVVVDNLTLAQGRFAQHALFRYFIALGNQ